VTRRWAVPAAVLALIAGIAGTLVPGPAMGQSWTVDLHAGRATFNGTLPDASSSNASLGVRFAQDRRFFQVAVAAPLASDNLFWGVVSAGDRLVALRQGRFEAGVDLLGQAHAQRDPMSDVSGHGIRGDLFPVVSTSLGPLVAQGRSGLSAYRAGTDEVSWSRELWVSDLQLTAVPRGPYRITGEARHSRTSDEAYTYVGVTGQTILARLLVWGSVGEWVSGLNGEIPTTAWGVGAGIPVLQNLDAWASVRRDPFDPLFLSTTRTSWGVGVSFRPGASRPPTPSAGPEVRDDGRVFIRLPLVDASAPPAVAGDFTGWEPVLMHRHGTHWRLEISLEPGVYHFAFRTADGEWFVPESTPGRRDDGMGGWVAVLVVP
jgi:hypothetical protein